MLFSIVTLFSDEIKMPTNPIKPHGLPDTAWNPWMDLRKR